MTTSQKNAIASPLAGLTVYDTTLSCLSFFDGSLWNDMYRHITRVRGELNGFIFNRTTTGYLYDGFIPTMEQFSAVSDLGLIWTCPKSGWYNVQISGHKVDSGVSGRLDFVLTISSIGDIELCDYTLAETSPEQLDRPVIAETMKFTAGQTVQPKHHAASVRKYSYINFMVSYVGAL